MYKSIFPVAAINKFTHAVKILNGTLAMFSIAVAVKINTKSNIVKQAILLAYKKEFDQPGHSLLQVIPSAVGKIL